MIRFHSQFQEDKWILENLKPDVGTYCEVGAYDGVLSSNTIALEDLGWEGVLVEADPHLADHCLIYRKAITWCCACGKPWFGTFWINGKDRGASGMQVNTDHCQPIMVPVLPLHMILQASGFDTIDLVSIDTEGTELTVWNTIGDYRPKIVIMEYKTFDNPPNDAAIVERMERDGYKEVHRTLCNLVFVPR